MALMEDGWNHGKSFARPPEGGGSALPATMSQPEFTC